jgi:hypothetical protein
MKRLVIIILVLLAFGVVVSAQNMENTLPSVVVTTDTVTDRDNIQYLLDLDQISEYHESDWLVEEGDYNEDGEWIKVYFNDTRPQQEVYVYYMKWNNCYKLEIYLDEDSIRYAKAVLYSKK